MYQLEEEMEGNVSDRGCDYKTRAERTYRLVVGRKGGGEAGRRVKLRLRLQNEGRDDIQPGGGEGDMSDRGCDYKRGQGRRTACRWRGRVTCQIAVTTTK
jgi:hypothetical protein